MMNITWYLLGILTGLVAVGLHQLSQRMRLTWVTWSGLIIGIGCIIFSFAWAVGSYLEGVPRAAAMGLMFFGLGGLVIVAISARLIGRQNAG